jgi:surfeit locus 1 family protein
MAHLTRSIPQCHRVSGSSLTAVLAVTVAVSVFAAAGFWQLHRAHYKDQLQARTEAALHEAAIELPGTRIRIEDVELRNIHVRGEWVADKTIFIDNKIQDAVVGYQVVTPLRITPGDLQVLVNRGWVAAPARRSELPSVTTASGAVEINGIARTPSSRFLELSNQSKEGEQERVWQNLTIERFEAWSGLTLQPVVIYQQNPGDDGLQRVSVAPDATGLNADRHRGYALTWFGLAIVTFVLAITAKLKSKKNGKEN